MAYWLPVKMKKKHTQHDELDNLFFVTLSRKLIFSILICCNNFYSFLHYSCKTQWCTVFIIIEEWHSNFGQKISFSYKVLHFNQCAIKYVKQASRFSVRCQLQLLDQNRSNVSKKEREKQRPSKTTRMIECNTGLIHISITKTRTSLHFHSHRFKQQSITLSRKTMNNLSNTV